jgi:hypothetical protein
MGARPPWKLAKFRGEDDANCTMDCSCTALPSTVHRGAPAALNIRHRICSSPLPAAAAFSLAVASICSRPPDMKLTALVDLTLVFLHCPW